MGFFRSSSEKQSSSSSDKHNSSTSSHRSSQKTESSLSLASSNSSIQSPTTFSWPSVKREEKTAPYLPSITAPSHRPKVAMPKVPDPAVDPASYLRSLNAVRDRCGMVLEKAKANQLNHFDVDMAKFDDCASFVVGLIKRDFADLGYDKIPPHGRWQHFNVGDIDRITHLLQSWPSTVDTEEKTRRLLDLFLVSVLLDAGAGNTWTYKSKSNGKSYRRSEGLAVASLEMFKAGLFSSSSSNPYQVDATALSKLTTEAICRGLQVSEANPLAGLEGRASLLIKLGEALGNTSYFGADKRPGGMLDYLLNHPTTTASSVLIVPVPTLWHALMDGLAPIWPASRTVLDGVSLGDAWPLRSMEGEGKEEWEKIVPFHKLTQWLAYSLMQPMAAVMHIHFAGAELMTGLPEYRNGGLFIDLGVLTLKGDDKERGVEIFKCEAKRNCGSASEVVPCFEPSDDVVVEWRAITVGFLDELLDRVNKQLGLGQWGEGEPLTLPQMLEAGSWKGGREIAEVTRPNTKCPPIMILSDGTVF